MFKRILATLLLALPSQPASVLTVSKTPVEAFNVAVDFSQVVGSNGITLDSVTATQLDTGADLSHVVISASPAPSVATSITVAGVAKTGQFVVVRVQGGSNGQRILVGIRALDAVTGEKYEGQFTLVVSSGTGR